VVFTTLDGGIFLLFDSYFRLPDGTNNRLWPASRLPSTAVASFLPIQSPATHFQRRSGRVRLSRRSTAVNPIQPAALGDFCASRAARGADYSPGNEVAIHGQLPRYVRRHLTLANGRPRQIGTASPSYRVEMLLPASMQFAIISAAHAGRHLRKRFSTSSVGSVIGTSAVCCRNHSRLIRRRRGPSPP